MKEIKHRWEIAWGLIDQIGFYWFAVKDWIGIGARGGGFLEMGC